MSRCLIMHSRTPLTHRELCYEFADVINGPGLPNLVSLTVGGNTAPSKAANNKNGGLFPSIFTAPHDKTPRLTYVHVCHALTCVNRAFVYESVQTCFPTFFP